MNWALISLIYCFLFPLHSSRTKCFPRLPEEGTRNFRSHAVKETIAKFELEKFYGWDWLPVIRGSDDYLYPVRLSECQIRLRYFSNPCRCLTEFPGRSEIRRPDVLCRFVLIFGCFNTFPHSTSSLSFPLSCSEAATALLFSLMTTWWETSNSCRLPFRVWTITSR